MREIVSPARQRELNAQKPPNLAARMVEAKLAESTAAEKLAVALRDALEPLKARDIEIIRREVALRLPDTPMSREQQQQWLDERTLGVARYMMTGRITVAEEPDESRSL